MAELETWQESFAQAAAKDAIELEAHTFEWASEPGHLYAYARATDSLKTMLAA